MKSEPKSTRARSRLSKRFGFVTGLLIAGLTSGGHSVHADSDTAYARMFYNAGYGYCDARKLSKILRVSIYRAKVMGGQKIASGNINLLRQQWRQGVQFFQRHGFTCGSSSLQTDSSKYAYSDSERVADIWKS